MRRYLFLLVASLLGTSTLSAQTLSQPNYWYNQAGDRTDIVRRLHRQADFPSSFESPNILDSSSRIRHLPVITLGELDSLEKIRHGILLERLQGRGQSRISTFDPTKDIGEILVQDEVSSSGARVISVPIPTAAGYSFAPSVAITYNSQSGDGDIAFGWHLTGLSSIRTVDRSVYFDGDAKASTLFGTDRVFELDGERLVTGTILPSIYSLQTANSKVLVKHTTPIEPTTRQANDRFDVAYPNGCKAVFEPALLWERSFSFPIKEITDANGRRISFEYVTIEGTAYISNIRYGYDQQGLSHAHISFSYEDNPYSLNGYRYGTEYSKSKLLSSVTSYDGNAAIVTYSFQKENHDNATLLKSISCTSDGRQLNPLRFDYAEDPHFEDDFRPVNTVPLATYYSGNSCINKSGRFFNDSFENGAITYPRTITSSGKVILTPSFDIPRPQSFLFNAGISFLGAFAGDVNGNGQDELILVNYMSSSGGTSAYRIRTYGIGKTLENDLSVKDSSAFSLLVDANNENYFIIGNFTGEGKASVVFVSDDCCNWDYLDYPLSSTATRITNNEIYRLADHKQFLALDLNSDGKDEICIKHGTSLYAYRLSADKSSLECTLTLDGLPSSASLSNLHFSDINADGYIDVIVHPSSGETMWKIYLNTGTSLSYSTQDICQVSDEDDLLFMDINRDGYPDLVRCCYNRIKYHINNRGLLSGQESVSGVIVTPYQVILPMSHIGQGLACHFITVGQGEITAYNYSADISRERMLYYATSSNGLETFCDYDDISYSNVLCLSSQIREYDSANGFHRTVFPLTVVSSSSVRGQLHRSYVYSDAVVNSQGLGFCGFGQVSIAETRSTSPVPRYLTTTTYAPDKGGLIIESTGRCGTCLMSFQSNTYDNNLSSFGKPAPRISYSHSADLLQDKYHSSYYTYGLYDLPTRIVTVHKVDETVDQRDTAFVSYLNHVTATEYHLGLPVSVTRSVKKTGAEQWKKRRTTTYDNKGRPTMVGEHVGHRGENQETLTTYSYDSVGNLLSESVFSHGATSGLSTSYTYDEAGRFVITKTDPIGNTTSYGARDKWGNTLSIIDVMGNTTFTETDAWGQIVRQVNADGSICTINKTWSEDGLYTVTSASTGKPTVIDCYDAFGRVIKNSIQRFDGRWLHTITEYDEWGRKTRTSLPHMTDSTILWTSYEYDEFMRPLRVLSPSGGQQTWAYNYEYTTQSSNGVSKTIRTDAVGDVVEVTDAGGTVLYNLRSDGQPSSISVSGGGTTSFSYDGYGRRTSIIDPSAGIRSEGYAHFSDGSSMVTSTNPKGSLISTYDKYGRVTSVQRNDEFNTTYTYDAFGRPISELSTNGTGRTLSYDNYGRVLTERESVPDGKWLQKTYSYGDGSNPASVQYSTNAGIIVSELYSYTNGHLSRIDLSDGTMVFRLDNEDGGGRPSAIMTGDIDRTYSYTPEGLPTRRTMFEGSMQDMNYQFDPLTGNMLHRQDMLFSQEETFGYDSLNRLVSMGERQISYSANGNISSIGDVGTLNYNSSTSPFRVSSITLQDQSLVPGVNQSISYTSFDRPSQISENGYTASFTYNSSYDRVKMEVLHNGAEEMTRYYVGNNYECDIRPEGVTERLYLGGDAYSAPMVYIKESETDWMAYCIGRDCLGSVTQIAEAGGPFIAEYSFDPWGRLRDPETLEIYGRGEEAELFLGRGYTGHEHLPWFGLINMNARLYDPLLGRFLSPDPYVQAPDFTQNFNRYSYALNNPLKYTDEDGEWIHIVFGALLGGVGNLIANWNNCDGFWEYFVSFGVGASAGAAVAATGGAAAAGGGFWATAGVIGVGATGSAVTGATGDIIRQTGENFAGIDNLDWNSVGISAAAGGVSGAASAGVGVAMYGVHIPVTVNGTTIDSPILSSYIAGAATGAAGHIAGGTIAGVLWGDSFDVAFWNSFEGIGASVMVGGAFSAASTAAYCIADGVNPLNGEQLSIRILPSAKSLGLESEVKRITDGTNYPQFRNDGTTFSNREGLLPGGVSYKEYVVPPISGYGPGANRIVVGSDNTWYYTPDHYKTFIRFKP